LLVSVSFVEPSSSAFAPSIRPDGSSSAAVVELLPSLAFDP